MSFEKRMVAGIADEASYRSGYQDGHADAERELRAPVACGHPRACSVHTGCNTNPCSCPEDGVQQYHGYCAACRREQELREQLRVLAQKVCRTFATLGANEAVKAMDDLKLELKIVQRLLAKEGKA